MKKFVRKVILLTLLVTSVIVIFFSFQYKVIGSQYSYSYQASLIDKINRLESIEEPKIILVGNSNLPFGMCSDELQKALDMPVVNLGLHGGLGNVFHERIARLNIGSGDIVVVCHSCFSDDDGIDNPSLAWITYDCHPHLLSFLRMKDFVCLAPAYFGYWRQSFSLWYTGEGNMDSGGCYSRSAFNEFGDVVYKPQEGQMDVESYFAVAGSSAFPEINDNCVERLNDFNEYCTEKGATLVVAGYPIASGKYTPFSKADFKAFQSELDKQLECDIISDYTDYFYPYEYFYNTELHLNEKGAKVRTQQLISDLRRWMEE